MKLFKNPRTALAAALTSAALIAAAGVTVVAVAFEDDAPRAAAAQVTVEVAAPAAQSDSKSVAEIYEASSKGVVEITVSSTTAENPFGGDGGTQQSQGSGFVYDDQGHVLTNQHVVAGAE